MKADKILVPVDFSEYQETVLDLATSLASACGARLVIVYAADPARTYGESTVFSGVSDPQREVMEKMLPSHYGQDAHAEDGSRRLTLTA